MMGTNEPQEVYPKERPKEIARSWTIITPSG